MSNDGPRRLLMNRAARLESAKHWLPTYEGRDVVKGYRKWYGVSTVCAIIELRQLGVKIDEQRLIQATCSIPRNSGLLIERLAKAFRVVSHPYYRKLAHGISRSRDRRLLAFYESK